MDNYEVLFEGDGTTAATRVNIPASGHKDAVARARKESGETSKLIYVWKLVPLAERVHADESGELPSGID